MSNDVKNKRRIILSASFHQCRSARVDMDPSDICGICYCAFSTWIVSTGNEGPRRAKTDKKKGGKKEPKSFFTLFL